MKRFLIVAVAASLSACAAQQPTPEQLAARQQVQEARQKAIAAECKLYEGTGVTPDECKKKP